MQVFTINFTVYSAMFWIFFIKFASSLLFLIDIKITAKTTILNCAVGNID